MSSPIRVVAPIPPEVTALAKTCESLAQQHALDRFELAVKARVEHGINDDIELRQADELLHKVVLGGDAIEAATKPAISAAHAVHKALIAEAKRWKERWLGMRSKLERAISDYERRKADLARRQQAEIYRAAEEERRRKAEAARAALRDGDVPTAQALAQEAQTLVAPVLMHAEPKLEHSTKRTVWAAKVTDPKAVVKGIAAGVIPVSVIKEFDMTLIKREAAKRGGLDWPGIEVWQETARGVRR